MIINYWAKGKNMEKTVNEEPISNENEVTQQKEAEIKPSKDNETNTESNDTENPSKVKNKDFKKLEAENKNLSNQVEQIQKKIDELNEKYLRMLAEYDNFRRRSAKEREGVYTEAYSEAVKEFLPVLDNVERAMQYSDDKNVTEGISLILKGFNDTFQKLGVMEIESLGKTFDPNFHNAILHVEDEKFVENEIVEVLQKGYIKDGKVIRCAMVKVAN